MTTRDYPRLRIEDFGAQLLRTGDLDPIYVALHELRRCGMSYDSLSKWLVAYWCFYSAGVACHMSEQATDNDFWDAMATAAENVAPAPHGGRWERGKERRHFRGRQGILAVEELAARHLSPCSMLDDLTEADEVEIPFAEVVSRAQENRGFGPWISYKVADMVERILGGCEPATAEDAMYEEPVKAAILAWAPTCGEGPGVPNDTIKVIEVVSYLQRKFDGETAPPGHDRPLGYQEIETILCKWKSHVNGHYPLLNDIHEIRAGLEPWQGCCRTARQFLAAMPSGQEVEK